MVFTPNFKLIRVIWFLDVLNSSKQNSLGVLEALQAQCLLWDRLDPKNTPSKDMDLGWHESPVCLY